MFGWNLFPHSDFEKINLDWIMRKLAEIDPQGNENPVSYDPQTPDATEQAQARSNLGLGDLSVEDAPLTVDKGGTGAIDKGTAAMNLEAVSWGAAQTLNSTQKQQARDNIGCGDLAVENSPLPIAKGGTGAIDKGTATMNLEAVSWGAAQTLNNTQIATAQENLGLRYKPGDSFIITTRTIYAGVITNGTKDMYFSIPVDFLLDDITGVIVDSFVGGVRCPSGGYIEGVTDGDDWVNTPSVTVTASIAGKRTVKITITKPSALTNGVNNTPVAISANVTLRFS